MIIQPDGTLIASKSSKGPFGNLIGEPLLLKKILEANKSFPYKIGGIDNLISVSKIKVLLKPLGF